ncbi:MAG TPA: LamG-like jellyroll fold domain-containing protein [Nonomuraea sp.]|nr:LamG-like jellyroll fold domain-containing protein [Nonomuraea sp.]
MTSEQNERRDVYANPDGSFTAELWTNPVRARRGSDWVAVDTTLRERSGGGVEPGAAVVPVVFSGGGDEPLVRIQQDDKKIELRWPTPLPKPQLSGDSATYPEVLPGVDLRMTAMAEGFRQILVIKDRTAAANPKLAELGLALATEGVEVRDDGDGNVGAYDAKGNLIFSSLAPKWRDSTPARPARPAGEVELDKSKLVLQPDEKVLTDAEATFPVQIMADYPARWLGWAMVFSGHLEDEYWGGDGDGEAKVGYCGWDWCFGIGKARSYFQYDAAFLSGRHVIDAEFNIFEQYAPACRTPRVVQAYATAPVSSATNWKNQPFDNTGGIFLSEANVSYGYDASCPGAWVGFPATRAVTNALANHGGRTAIMLKAENEGDALAWKKFKPNPSLAVSYNSYPDRPTSQTIESKGCASQPNEPYVNPFIDNDPNKGPRGPKMSAKLTDDDGGLLRAQFEWYPKGGSRLGVATTAQKSSGSIFTADVPAENALHGTTLTYRVRGTDGIDYGQWGSWCDVTIDRQAPDKGPGVSSQTYPKCDTANDADCPGGGSVGYTGGFTLNANGVTDVVAFEYYLYGHEGVFRANATSGTANVLVTPPEDGPMDLIARSVDRAGNKGPETRYHFWVGEGTPPKGHWKLDGFGGTNVVDDSPNGHDATVTRGPTRWQAGRQRYSLWLDGASGHASTAAGSTVDTSKSFAVSAWVKLDRLDTEFRTAVSQSGNQISGFFLQYNPNSKRWNFVMPASDANAADRHIAQSASLAVAGRWTHLVGMYDAAARQVKIYVDGVAGTPGSHTTPWQAMRTVQLGRAIYNQLPYNYWLGAIDEVRIYDRTLSVQEIHDLAGAPAVEELFLPLDDGQGTTAQDVSGNYRLSTIGTGGTWTAGKVGTGAVRFDGTDAAMAADSAAVRTDSSFTVTAWTKLTADDRSRTILSQNGTKASGFQLRYRSDTRKWSFALPQSDIDNPAEIAVDSGVEAQTGEWTHLAGVYDVADQRIRIYVNGTLEGEKAATAPWNATGAFQVGRGQLAGRPSTPFAGEIDDVHAWTGVRTKDQIKAEYLDPVTKRIAPYGGQLSRYNNAETSRHMVTTAMVPQGASLEFSFGLMAPSDATEPTRTIYSCRNGTVDYFLAHDCGTHANLGSIGNLYRADLPPPAGVPTILVYRCLIPNFGHFVSSDPNCENQTAEFPLGYTRAYRRLVRHVTTGFPHDHASAVSRIEGNYRAEGPIGTVSMAQLPGTTALMNCRLNGDTFTSTDAACEGGTVVSKVGYIWTSPPQDVPGAPGAISAELFRCVSNWGDLFDSLDRACEGHTLQRSLGFVVTGL